MRLGYADCLGDIGRLDKIQCDHGPVVTLVACILHSITLITQDAGFQIATLLDLLECPVPYVLSPRFCSSSERSVDPCRKMKTNDFFILHLRVSAYGPLA